MGFFIIPPHSAPPAGQPLRRNPGNEAVRLLVQKAPFRYKDAMSARRFLELDDLIRRANQLGTPKPNPTDRLAGMIRLVAQSGADPYDVAGILIEGAVHVVTQHVPPAERADVARAIRDLLSDRLDAHGL